MNYASPRQCFYDAVLNIKNFDYRVMDKPTHEVVGFGQFDSGFSMKFFGDGNFTETMPAGAKFFIGSTLFVAVEWNLTSLRNKLKFVVQDCFVRIDAMAVQIVKDRVRNYFSHCLN